MDLGGSSEERRGEMEAARQDPNRGNARVRGAVWVQAINCVCDSYTGGRTAKIVKGTDLTEIPIEWMSAT